MDSNRKFLHIVAGSPGSYSDARILDESYLGQYLNLFCGEMHFLIGDSIYPLSKYLIKPYGNFYIILLMLIRFIKVI